MSNIIPTIKTERLVLRPFSEEDVGSLYEILEHRDMLRYFPGSQTISIERVQKLISRQLLHWDEHDFGWWAVQTVETHALVGWSGLTYLPETDEIEIAYLVSKPYWGIGLATEASRVGINYGFEKLGLDLIVGIVHPENLASQRVLEKLGLHFVERSRYFGMDCFRYIIEGDIDTNQ